MQPYWRPTKALTKGIPSSGRSLEWEAADAMMEEAYDLRERAIALPARTPEGLQAKAKVVAARINDDDPIVMGMAFDCAGCAGEGRGMSTRRDLLAGAVATVAVPVATSQASVHPDAELIRLCAEHIANRAAYNRDGGGGPMDAPDPLWDAYVHTRDAISDARPCTLDGMLAKARAAKAEAQLEDGGECPEGSPSERWAWQLLNDLLAGRARA